MSGQEIDVLIVTALKDELDALEERIQQRSEIDLDGAIPNCVVPVRTANLRSHAGKTFSIAIARPHKMGQAAAAAVTSALVERLRPRVLAMCGVCAGNPRKTTTGDVIIGDNLFPFDHGKRIATDDKTTHLQDITGYNLSPQWKILAEDLGSRWASTFLSRPPTLEYQERTLLRLLWEREQGSLPEDDLVTTSQRFRDWKTVIQRLLRKDQISTPRSIIPWFARRPVQVALTRSGRARAHRELLEHPDQVPEAEFKVHVAPIAMVGEVVEDPTIWRRIEAVQRSALGLEMEGAAVGVVQELSRTKNLIVVKAVQDYADGDKADHFRAFAARASADFLLFFLAAALDHDATERGEPRALRSIRSRLSAASDDIKRVASELETLLEQRGVHNDEGGESVEQAFSTDALQRLNDAEALILLTASRVATLELTAQDVDALLRQTSAGARSVLQIASKYDADSLPDRQELVLGTGRASSRTSLVASCSALSILLSITTASWKRQAARLGLPTFRSDATSIACEYNHDRDAWILRTRTDDIDDFDAVTRYLQLVRDALDHHSRLLGRLVGPAVRPRALVADLVAETPFVQILARFEVDPQAAIQTFVGRNLYDDSSVVLRELIQNAIDAIHLRRHRDATAPRGQVRLRFDSASRTLTVTDNGIGMSVEDVSERLLMACARGFRELAASEQDVIARFGIGFLSVFLLGTSVAVTSRRYDRAEGICARIRRPGLPVRIDVVPDCEVGTTVAIELRAEEHLSQEDLRRWLPAISEDLEVRFQYDNEPIIPEVSEPRALGPFRFESNTYRSDDDFANITLKMWNLRLGSEKALSCGLGFQRLDDLNRQIVSLPEIRQRLFIKGVPVHGPKGRSPNFPEFKSSNTYLAEPLLWNWWVPASIDLKKPGSVEFTLARNGVLDTTQNRDVFSRISLAIANQLAQHFSVMAKSCPANEFATSMIEEHWLARTLCRRPIPGITEGALSDDPMRLALSPIWDALQLKIWSGGRFVSLTLADVRKRLGCIVLCSEPFIAGLVDAGFDPAGIEAVVKRFWPTAGLCAGLDPLPKREGFGDILFVAAKEIALLDVSSSGCITSPLVVLDLRGDAGIPAASRHRMAIFGSDDAICPFVVNHVANGHPSGGGVHFPIANRLCDTDLPDEFLRTLDDVTNYPRLIYRPGRRESLADVLRGAGLKQPSAVKISRLFDLPPGATKLQR